MARISIDAEYPLFPVEPNLFGHFTEHAFGNIYGGLYDPDSPLADEDGFRTDVLELLRKVKVPLLRYPGGNFVSNYHWEEGIGPKQNRRRLFEYAWLTEESNQFGTADFILLCRKIGAEPLICVNMGSGTPEEAMHWVEYCNGTGNTYYANLRREHGYPEPFHVHYWGIGNEMYGNWQMQNQTAEDYAKSAFQFCKAIKWVDPSVKLIACGLQDNADWNHTVMKAIGPMVDYISAHHYAIDWGLFEDHNYLQSMYIADHMELLNRLTVSTIHSGMNDVTRSCKVAWDEWNMFGWVIDGVNEDARYTLQNALVTGLILNMMIRNSDTIGMANYSTFVNINGAIRVYPDRVLKRSQFSVFELMTRRIGSRVLEVKGSIPTMTVPTLKNRSLGRPPLGLSLVKRDAIAAYEAEVSMLDCVATMADDGTIYLSVINKSPDQDLPLEIDLRGLNVEERSVTSEIIWNESIEAANTLAHPESVDIREGEAVRCENGQLKTRIRSHSINMFTIR